MCTPAPAPYVSISRSVTAGVHPFSGSSLTHKLGKHIHLPYIHRSTWCRPREGRRRRPNVGWRIRRWPTATQVVLLRWPARRYPLCLWRRERTKGPRRFFNFLRVHPRWETPPHSHTRCTRRCVYKYIFYTINKIWLSLSLSLCRKRCERPDV